MKKCPLCHETYPSWMPFFMHGGQEVCSACHDEIEGREAAKEDEGEVRNLNVAAFAGMLLLASVAPRVSATPKEKKQRTLKGGL